VIGLGAKMTAAFLRKLYAANARIALRRCPMILNVPLTLTVRVDFAKEQLHFSAAVSASPKKMNPGVILQGAKIAVVKVEKLYAINVPA